MCGLMVQRLDRWTCDSEGRGFNSLPRAFSLGKLFIHIHTGLLTFGRQGLDYTYTIHAFTHTQKIKLCLCHQVVKFGTGEGAVMPLLQISFYCKQSFSLTYFPVTLLRRRTRTWKLLIIFHSWTIAYHFFHDHVKWIRITQSLRQPSFLMLCQISRHYYRTTQHNSTELVKQWTVASPKIRLYMLHTPLFRTWIRYGAQWSRFCLPQLMLSLTKSNLCQVDLESTIT